MLENSLNIGGSEWMIIIFVAVVLVLGTGKLPGAAKKMGKVVSEYNNAKNEIQQQMKEVNEEVPKISGPVETERENYRYRNYITGNNFKKEIGTIEN